MIPLITASCIPILFLLLTAGTAADSSISGGGKPSQQLSRRSRTGAASLGKGGTGKGAKGDRSSTGGKTSKGGAKSKAEKALECIPEPYPDAVVFNTTLEDAITCFRESLGDPGTDGTTIGVWYSSHTNDRATMQLNSAVSWGTTEDPNPPSIIARPKTDKEVKEALACSIQNGIRVVPWSKGHNWEGLTALPNYAVIRLDRICDVTVDPESKSMTISSGCATGHQVGKLSLFHEEKDERMLLNFGCPNIGIGGSFSGGGQGYFSGYIGMQIDAVEKIHFLLYDKKGHVKEVVAESTGEYEELFWAARGGMSGYGIITKLELKTIESPSPGAVTWIDLYYNKSSRGMAQYLFQELILSDSYFGIAQSNRFDTTGSQIRVSYLGTAVNAIQKLKKVGMLDASLLDTAGTYALTPDKSSLLKNYKNECKGMDCVTKYGIPERSVMIFEYPNFREFTAMAWFNPALVNRDTACDQARYGLDCGPDQYSFISNQVNALEILEMAENASSDLLEPTSPFWNTLPISIFQSPGLQWRLTKEGWEKLAEVRDSSDDIGCKYTLLFTHATGGVAADVHKSDTAYYWRGYPLLNFLLGDTSIDECKEFLLDVSEIREKYAVDGYASGGAYINYPGNPNNCCNGATENDLPWEQLYYGGNYERLQKARMVYDPLNVYSKPQLPEPERECKRGKALRG